MVARRLSFLAALVVVPAALAVTADTPRPPASTPLRTWTAEVGVGSILPAGGRVYVAGSFGSVGPSAGPLLVLRARDGTLDRAVAQLSGGDVETVAPDGRGGWFLGGDFAYAGGVRCGYLAHVEASGRIDRGWCPHPNGAVRLIARAGDTLYLAGAFTRVGEAARATLAAVRVDTGGPTGWRPAVPRSASILALAAEPGRVFVGGDFTAFGGRPTSGLAALDATTGRTLDWNARLDRSTCSTREPCVVPVGAISVASGIVYVAGRFDLVAGKRRVGFAAVDARTARPLSWQADVDREALSFTSTGAWRLLASGRTVYVTWPSERIRGVSRPGIAALDARTGAVQPWRPTLPGDADISAFAVGRSTVTIAYLRGLAETYGVRSVDRTRGSVIGWTRTDFCCQGNFGTAVAVGDRVLITSSIGVRGRFGWNYGLAAFDPSTGRMLTWRPRLDSPVEALAASNTTLYIAGAFTKADGQRRNRLAAFDLRTGKLLPWNPDAGDNVSSIALDGSTLYVGGDFTSIGGSPRGGLAAVDATTGAVKAWDPQPSDAYGGGEVSTIAARGSIVYVAGSFSAIGGAARSNLAAVDAASGAATTWNPKVDSVVSAIALGPASLFIAGGFSHVQGAARGGLAEVDLATGAPTPFDPLTNIGTQLNLDDPLALDLADEILLVGGTWTASFGGVERFGLAALDAQTARLLDWQPTNENSFPAPHVYALAHDALRVYIGGALALNGDNGFAVFAR